MLDENVASTFNSTYIDIGSTSAHPDATKRYPCPNNDLPYLDSSIPMVLLLQSCKNVTIHGMCRPLLAALAGWEKTSHQYIPYGQWWSGDEEREMIGA